VLFRDGGLLVGDAIESFQDSLGFSGQSTLFDTDGGSLDLDDSDISGDLVTLLDLKMVEAKIISLKNTWTISPGTTSLEGTWIQLPSRRTRASILWSSFKASIAFSAS